MEKGGALKMMSDEALSAFRRNVMDQTELVWHTRETVLTLIDEIIRLRKELDKRMWSTNAPDASQAPTPKPWDSTDQHPTAEEWPDTEEWLNAHGWVKSQNKKDGISNENI